MLDMTVAYVCERRQFGVPVGSFQAVKHRLADALKELAFARPAVHRAAHSLATGAETRARDVAMAKAMASDAARFVGRQALQCHGAIGYTVEHDLHLYLKRTWALAAAWGDAAWHRARVPRALGVGGRPAADRPRRPHRHRPRRPGGDTMAEAYIVDAVRSPVGKRGGGLAQIHPADLGAHAIRALVERTGIDPAAVDDVVFGNVDSIGGQAGDIARTCWLAAGLPEH